MKFKLHTKLLSRDGCSSVGVGTNFVLSFSDETSILRHFRDRLLDDDELSTEGGSLFPNRETQGERFPADIEGEA